uniref:ATP-grasp domain-containing protein n=1 Tax=Mucochytrium quahogii TaxID=96639 RepID=A0A7S2SAY9_9STRA|mmetsp:Transcript_3325/g.7057  ORF Transcript_3325/g.7057 Transcript_3325/m.7057 type:complete len:441 (+) Transcript_3325:1416-2738(+)
MKPTVVVVDPSSTGKCVVHEFIDQGFKVLAVVPELESKNIVCQDMLEACQQVFSYSGDTQKLVQEIEAASDNIGVVTAGGENGVELADELAHHFGTLSNPAEMRLARRNKYNMGEAVRAAGVRAVEQSFAMCTEDVDNFLARWTPEPYKIIVKPNESSGSDDVFLCHSEEEVRAAFQKIQGTQNAMGVKNHGALIQEFLSGPEFVVDTISRNGEHKVCTIWKYDKRHVNGQFNVYFGMVLQDASDEQFTPLIEYAFSVLDALQIKNGPGHAEIMWTPTGPCLVEIGSRPNGLSGFWQPLASAGCGVDQVTSIVKAYTDPVAFDELPVVPTRKLFGRVVFMVSYESGYINELPGLEMTKSLESYVQMNFSYKTGDFCNVTIDMFTATGIVLLMHESSQQVEDDVAAIHDMCKAGKFIVVERSNKPQDPALDTEPVVEMKEA